MRALKAVLLAIAACLPVDASAERVVVYANVGGGRVDVAFERLKRALDTHGVFARYGVVVRHEIVHEHEPELLRGDMERIVAARPLAILAPGHVIAAAAKKATSAAAIPVIFGTFESPVHLGLVDAMARPGGNLTGFTSYMPLDEKRLELLKELAPGARRIGVLSDGAWLRQPHVRPSLAQAQRALGVAIEIFPIGMPDELPAILHSQRGRAVQAWYVPFVEVAFQHPDFVVESLRSTGKPVIYPRLLYAQKGGVAAYQSEPEDVFDVWAKLLARVLAGVPPAIIPVEGPRQFELALNVTAAKAAGINIPRSLLRRADWFY